MMTTPLSRCVAALTVCGVLMSAPAPLARQQGSKQVFRAAVDLVTVNVVVRDKQGRPVQGLTRDDFTILEDGKPQVISTFKAEEISNEPQVAHETELAFGSLAKSATAAAAPATPTADASARRLIVLFFDMSAMETEEAERAVQASRDYVTTKLTASDAVAVVSLSTSLQVVQDFTADRTKILAAVASLSTIDGSAFETGASTDTDTAADTGNSYTPDDSEYAIFNTDQRLDALRRMADALKHIPQKKSLVYFSSGISQSGLDNDVQLRLAVDHAVRANVSIYAADMRGLQAEVPGGDASQGSVRGQGAFSGESMREQFDETAASQDTLATLSEDTGGQAFFDTNDFAPVFDRVVADTTTYYLIGFSTTNNERDGRFRRLKIAAKRPDVKLEYRAGYYAPRDFAHSGRDDREQQMQEQLESDLSVTDLPIHGSAAYFRIKPDRFFVPVWFVVPGSAIPFKSSSDRDKATLDILGVVRDRQRRPVAFIRDTVKVQADVSAEVRKKTVQYQTSFELPPGQYLIKTVIRENQTGTLGTYEATLTVPRLPATGLKLSTVVLATQLQPAAKRGQSVNPLIRDGQELVPNITHVAANPQQLYFYVEVYDPTAAQPSSPGPPGGAEQAGVRGGAGDSPIRVLASVAFFKGRRRVYQTDVAEAVRLTDPGRKAVGFRISVPVADLQAGLYTCQLNIVDDAGGIFAFPRMAVYIRR